MVLQMKDKVLKDIVELHIGNWRRVTIDRKRWREIINKNLYVKPTYNNIKNIVYQYKQRAAQRRETELSASTGLIEPKVTELLVQENNQYTCPGCKKNFKPQGITNHVKSCNVPKSWCKRNKIN